MFSDKKKLTPEETATEELKILYEFVKIHFSITGDGAVFYKCPCQYPDSNCSSLQHHPELDVVIMALVRSARTQTAGDDEVAERPPSLLHREVYWILPVFALVWGILCFLDTMSHSLELCDVALIMILLTCFFSYLWVIHVRNKAES